MLTKLSDRLKPTPAYAHTNPAYRQHAFRFRSVNPTTAAINAAFDASDPALNTNWTTPSFTTNLPFRLRIEVEETAGGGGSISPTLWVRRNTSAYAQVSGTSSWVQSVAASFADGDATTNLISSSARTFLTGWGDDVDATGATVTYTGNQHTELDFCLQIVENSVFNGDTLEFQVRDGSTVLGTYGVTPLINVVKPVPILHQQAFRIRDDSIALNTDGGWLAAQDTNASFEAEKTFRIRFRVKVTGESKNTVQVSLRYSRNGGAYTAAFGQGTPSSPGITPATVEASVSDRYADQDAITSDLLTGATGTRVNGAGDEINGIHTTSSWEPDEYREFEFAIRIRKFYWSGSAVAENVDGTTFDFRLYDGSTPFDNYDVTPRVTVDSAGLVGGCWPEAPHHMGPIVDTNGNMYLFMESWELKTNGGWVVALKSTDGGLTWTAQDIADGPGATAGTDDWEGATVLQDNQVTGRVFLFSHHTSTVEKHIFFTSDHATTPDQWGTVGTVVSTFTAVLNSMQWVASAIRSDGDIILMYNTADATDNRTEYRISTDGGVNWSTAASLDTTAGESIYNAWPVIAEADLCYIFYHVNTGPTDDAAQVYYKTLSSADALSGRTQVSTNALGGGVGERGAIIGTGYYDDAGVEVVTVVWVDSLQATPVAVARSLRDGTLQSIETVSGVAVSDGGASGSNQFVGSVAVDAANKVLHVLYADATTFDVWHDSETDDGGWGTDTELEDAVDCLWVKANVVTRGSNKYLAYVYDNGTGSTGGGQGPVYYGETTLSSGPSPIDLNHASLGATFPAITVGQLSIDLTHAALSATFFSPQVVRQDFLDLTFQSFAATFNAPQVDGAIGLTHAVLAATFNPPTLDGTIDLTHAALAGTFFQPAVGQLSIDLNHLSNPATFFAVVLDALIDLVTANLGATFFSPQVAATSIDLNHLNAAATFFPPTLEEPGAGNLDLAHANLAATFNNPDLVATVDLQTADLSAVFNPPQIDGVIVEAHFQNSQFFPITVGGASIDLDFMDGSATFHTTSVDGAVDLDLLNAVATFHVPTVAALSIDLDWFSTTLFYAIAVQEPGAPIVPPGIQLPLKGLDR